MGHPAASVAWLANQLGERGAALKAGWIIVITAECDGLGTIEVFAA